MRGTAGRGGGICRAPPGRGTWERLSRRTKAAGDGSPRPNPFLLGPAPELELVLDTLSGRWRGSQSEPGQDSPATFGPGGRESRHLAEALGSPTSRAPSLSKLPGAPGPWAPGSLETD